VIEFRYQLVFQVILRIFAAVAGTNIRSEIKNG